VELSWRDRGAGPPLLLLHETAATGAIWDPLIEAVGADARTIAPDRRGWGDSGAPEPYAATTVEEHGADAAALMKAADAVPAVVCGAGLGAVAAIELLLRHGELVRAAIVVEPPLLALLPEATEGLAFDRREIAEAVAQGGPAAAMEAYLAGRLSHLGAGAERIPDTVGAEAAKQPLSLFAELGAVPSWPLRSADLLALDASSRIVVGGSTPPVLRAASEQLAIRLGGGELVDVGGEGLPHVGAARQLAALIRELL
jgi:pimeloyl-ACP methyl ester carboxylesterase